MTTITPDAPLFVNHYMLLFNPKSINGTDLDAFFTEDALFLQEEGGSALAFDPPADERSGKEGENQAWKKRVFFCTSIRLLSVLVRSCVWRFGYSLGAFPNPRFNPSATIGTSVGVYPMISAWA